jgi:succinyl-diaminopimelate desuccinylase
MVMSTPTTLDRVKQLISIPSVAGDSKSLHQAIDSIASILSEMPGITIERFDGDKPSLLAYKSSERPKKFAVILHGHLDVVPGKPEQFVPEIRDGKLYGRGAHDMKTAAVAMTEIFCQVVHEVPYALGLQIVTDEEIGGYEGVHRHIQSDLRADFVITGEHNFHEDVIYNAARGICWIEIEFTGLTAHGAYVWHGINAADKAAAFMKALAQTYPNPSEETWTTTASVASMHTTNTTYNKIPDHATIRVDFRFIAEDSNFVNRESVSKLVHMLDPEATIIDFAVINAAVHVDETNPYLQALAASLQQTIGKPVHFASRPGASDSRHYAEKGMDVVEFGMVGNDPHGDNEYIEVDSIANYVKTLNTFLTSSTVAALGQKHGRYENA